jgi:hypothetical protein
MIELLAATSSALAQHRFPGRPLIKVSRSPFAARDTKQIYPAISSRCKVCVAPISISIAGILVGHVFALLTRSRTLACAGTLPSKIVVKQWQRRHDRDVDAQRQHFVRGRWTSLRAVLARTANVLFSDGRLIELTLDNTNALTNIEHPRHG